jgi:hypothetical protein
VTAQTAQTHTLSLDTTSTKLENKPVGLANTIFVNNYEGNGFWLAEEVAYTFDKYTELDPYIGASNLEDEGTHVHTEATELCLTPLNHDNWLHKEPEDWLHKEDMAGMPMPLPSPSISHPLHPSPSPDNWVPAMGTRTKHQP